MPTALRSGPYRFFFYSGDGNEPAHMHVEREDRIAKFWIDPVRLESSGGFTRREIAQVEQIIVSHREALLECWNDFFGL